MRTTPTGIPITPCETCGTQHSTLTKHCTKCGVASRFLDGGWCLPCRKRAEDGARELFGEGLAPDTLDIWGGGDAA